VKEMDNKTILSVNDLTKIYGREVSFFGKTFGREVVGAQNVSFSVNKGEIFGFLGPNGAGKTTTIRSILDYLNVQSGQIIIFGMDHRKQGLEIRKNIGYVPGDVALYENFTGLELIEYFSKFRPVDESFLNELRSIFRADLTLKIRALSKGNRQQVALIAALAAKPDFLILDEPTGGLDPLMAVRFHRILKNMRKEGTTIFLSSHDLAEVQAICDRVGIIKEGKMIVIENIENLRGKFLQNVSIKFSSSEPEISEFERLESVIDVEKTDKEFKLKVLEDVNELLKFLTNYTVKRIRIEDATLEDIFLQYYE
jgi:ABC-2 type transport system ATP-binding protein